MKTLKAEIKQASDKSWFWHLKAANGRIVLVSETYGSRWKCIRSMEMVRKMSTATPADTAFGWGSPMSGAMHRAICETRKS
jgi:uncharacterized protein YegP (UPF0339 family)